MYTIKNNSIKEITIKNSKFITLLYKVYSLEDIKNTLGLIGRGYYASQTLSDAL